MAGRMGMDQKMGYRNRPLLCCHLGLTSEESVLTAGFIATSPSSAELHPLW